MSDRAYAWAAAQVLPSRERALLQVLAHEAHDQINRGRRIAELTGCSQAHFAFMTGLSPDAVRKALSGLRHLGLISWTTGYGSSANTYTLHVEEPTQPSLLDETALHDYVCGRAGVEP